MITTINPYALHLPGVIATTRCRIRYRHVKSRLSMSNSARTSAMTGLVSADWLHKNLASVKVLDASWHLPRTGRSAKEEFLESRIPEAQFFDIDAPGLSDRNTSLPHMLPSEEEFSSKMNDFGISNSDQVVVYDTNMFMAAARAWWMFRTFSHEQVAVLEGGIEEWKNAGLPLEKGSPKIFTKRLVSYRAVKKPGLTIDLSGILRNTDQGALGVVDARPRGRFHLLEDEPRQGVKRGRIPKSINIPWTEVIQGRKLLDEGRLQNLFSRKLGPSWKEHEWILSCGSGVSAAVVGLAMHKCGGTWMIYDGSWAEYGTADGVPTEA